MKLGFTLRGERRLRRNLDSLKEGVRNRIVKQAAAKLARKAAKAAKQNAPRGSQRLLKKSIGSQYRTYKSRAVWVYLIGPRRGHAGTNDAGEKRDPVRVAHIVERGRNAVRPTKRKALVLTSLGGIVRGFARRAAGKFFMRRAWNSIATAGRGQLIADIKAGIKREVAKYKARGKSAYDS